MNLDSVFLTIFSTLNIVILIFVVLTLYEYSKLEQRLFRFYIFGLLFYSLSVICVFLRYVVLPPLSNFESISLELGITLSAVVGIFYFIKGTEYLAQKEKPDFVRNETLYNLIFYSIFAYSIFLVFYALTLLVSKRFYEVLSTLSGLFVAIIVVLALKFLLEYKKAFGELIAKITFQYIMAVVLFIVGGIVVMQSLIPIETGDYIFTDLSYYRQIASIIGGVLVFIPFLICYGSISKFRKLLEG